MSWEEALELEEAEGILELPEESGCLIRLRRGE